MSIKNLLLGSTVALMGLSEVHANSTIVTSQESVQPVRICDAYGKGYVYIPGTEICLRLSGNVLMNLSGGDSVWATTDEDLAQKNKDYSAIARLALGFDISSETEWGTLHTYAEIRSLWSNGKDGAGGRLHAAYVELGGLRFGMRSTIFNSWVGDYGNVLNDDIVSPSGNTRTNFISYTLGSENALSAIVGAELGNTSGPALKNSNGTNIDYYYINTDKKIANVPDDELPSKKIKDYVPHLLVGLKLAQTWGKMSTILAYDAYYKKLAAKVRLDYKVNSRLGLWAMGGYKHNVDYYTANNDGVLSRVNSTIYANWGGKWAAWAGASYELSPKAKVNAQVSYSQVKTFSASANISYTLAPGLNILPELTYTSWNDSRTFKGSEADKDYKFALNGKHAFQAMLRIKHSF